MAKQPISAPRANRRIDSGIEKAENGFIIRVSSEGKGKNAAYTSRTFVAPNGGAAMRIATAHIQTLGPKMKQKKTRGKSVSTKR